MADPIVAALTGEEITKSNALATVTNDWIILRAAGGRTRVVLPLYTLTGVRRVRTTHPAFLVIASGVFLIAAGAYFSKDTTAALPGGVLSLFFFGAYFVTRRGSVLFTSGNETTETVLGSLRDAFEIVKAVRDAQDGVKTGKPVQMSAELTATFAPPLPPQ